jgi:hypothetical protein
MAVEFAELIGQTVVAPRPAEVVLPSPRHVRNTIEHRMCEYDARERKRERERERKESG